MFLVSSVNEDITKERKMSRQEFEKLEKVKELLIEYESDNILFNEQEGRYEAQLYTTFVPEYIDWLNGALWAFELQQKKIDNTLEHIKDETWVDEYGDTHCPVLKIMENLK